MKHTTNSVRDLIAQGFTTKVAKKDAGDKLNRAWENLSKDIQDSGIDYWDLPMYAHQVSAKTEKLVSGELLERVQDIRACYAELKAAEVVKQAAKVDDTKVREVSPAEATTEGIDYIDMAGDRRGYCYCCGRVGFKLNASGRLSRHGYIRPGYGYDLGGCVGTRLTPEQTLDEAIKWNGNRIFELEDLLATDLFAFSIKQARLAIKSGRVRRRDGWERKRQAAALRALRSGDENIIAFSGPSSWRRMLTAQLKQHQNTLRQLEAVKAGI